MECVGTSEPTVEEKEQPYWQDIKYDIAYGIQYTYPKDAIAKTTPQFKQKKLRKKTSQLRPQKRVKVAHLPQQYHASLPYSPQHHVLPPLHHSALTLQPLEATCFSSARSYSSSITFLVHIGFIYFDNEFFF